MRPGRQPTTLATLTLLLVTACWGSTFFLIKDLLQRIPVLDFLAVRFGIATVVVALLFPRAVRRLPRSALRQALLLGLLYGVGQILQTTGIGRTPATVSGFITGMYVVFTPLLAAPLLRQRIGAVTWAAVVVSVTGLGVLTLSGFSIGSGELLVLVSTVLYALHIVGLGAWSTAEDALGMTIVQLAVITVVCLLVTAPDGVALPQDLADWASVLYMAVFAAGLALAGQTWAQAHLPPTRSAIVMTMEPVFAALFAVALGGEDATVRMLVGGAMVLAAMLMVELAPRRKLEGEVPHIAV